MSSISRTLGAALACLAALALSACGSSIPETKIGNATVGRYVALGDGFVAAPNTGAMSKDGCKRSATDYPAQLARLVKARQLVDVSCAYASTADVLRSHRPAGGSVVPPQLDAVTKDTDLITLTVGLSDREFLRRVFLVCADPCDHPDGVSPQQLVGDLGQIAASIQETIDAIVKKAPDARLYVVGYPQILPRSGTCPAMPAVDQNQADGISSAISQLNASLRTAARLDHSYYVDATALSTGHDICSEDPWVQGVKGGPAAPPRYHPKAGLSTAIAQQLAAQLSP